MRSLKNLRPVRVVIDTVMACLKHRALGLAAESAFFMLLSLPPLIFGLVGAVGYIANAFEVTTIANLRTSILEISARVVTPEVVTDVLTPMLDDVLQGRIEVISFGFLLSLWAGSRAVAVFLDTVAIMYGEGGERGIVQTRAMSIWIYLVFLIMCAVVLPLVLIGPSLLASMLPAPAHFVLYLYWPFVAIGSTFTIKFLYARAVPSKRKWWADLPGAGLAFAIWLLGSLALRYFVTYSLGGSMLYGPLAAPIALLLWLHIISLALLIGAAFNAAVTVHYPDFRSPEESAEPAIDKTS